MYSFTTMFYNSKYIYSNVLYLVFILIMSYLLKLMKMFKDKELNISKVQHCFSMKLKNC